MKVIIAGSRDLNNYGLVVEHIVKSHFKITEIVCGMCRGPDLLGKKYAEENNIPVKEFPADWENLGNSAGPTRNKAMAEYADALILVWDGKSKGSFNMLNEAAKNKLEIYTNV